MMDNQKKLEILDILENNALTSAAEIGVMIDESEEDVRRAIAGMEEDGAILKYSAVVNRDVIDADQNAEALIEVSITPQREYGYDDMAKRIYRFEEVEAVYLTAGGYDLCVRIKNRSMKEISKFVFEKLAVIDGITRTVTVFIMRKYKEQGVILADTEKDDRLVVSP